jgi:hypothetical protein
LIDGEASVLPSIQEVRDLIHDPDRVESLIREASTAVVDPSLPSVRIEGNELGLVDYYDLAFKLFGIHLVALWLMYFVILSISVLLFVLTFRRCRFCILLLLFYLIGHAFMI